MKSSSNKTGVPSYLTKLVQSYLSESTFRHDMDEGLKPYTITAGDLQDSVLGPPRSNVVYNRLYHSRAKRVTIIGSADDLAVEVYANEIATKKTETVSTTNRRKKNHVGGHITSKRVIKYLGVMTDGKINLKGHLNYAYEKTVNTSNSLEWMTLDNTGGLRYSLDYFWPMWFALHTPRSGRKR